MWNTTNGANAETRAKKPPCEVYRHEKLETVSPVVVEDFFDEEDARDRLVHLRDAAAYRAMLTAAPAYRED